MKNVAELELFLVRHGESLGNIERTPDIKNEDLIDPVLTAKGRLQAECLGKYLENIDFDCIFSSGLNRAAETASAVVKYQKFANNLNIHPVFTECGTPFEGKIKTFGEIKAHFPAAVKAEGTEETEDFVLRNPDPTDEENFLRADAALTYLKKRFYKGEKVLVVSHAAFLTNVVFSALGFYSSPAFDLCFSNTGVTKLVFYKEGTGDFGCDTHLIYHNDRTHLKEGFPGITADIR